MSLELTENKSNIGSGALNDLVFILYSRVIRKWLPTNRQSVGDQLGSDRQPIGDRSATVSWAFVFDCRKSATFLRSVGNRSATKNCVGIVYNRCNWSAISRQPVGDQSATTKNLFTIDLVAERLYLQQPKPPCDQIVPATFCNRSATSRRLPCNHPATSLWPPEILVARRSPTGCKLCVTGALLVRTPHHEMDCATMGGPKERCLSLKITQFMLHKFTADEHVDQREISVKT